MNDPRAHFWLNEALKLAEKRQGFCAPNPAVGAVVVNNNQCLATGYHWGPYYDHAEKQALDRLNQQAAQGATLYVTLEPCCFEGRTPACTQLIIDKGIEQVVYGYTDPNPQVAGKGAEQLRLAGIDCQILEQPSINRFYEAYHYAVHHERPFIRSKLALTLNGKVADLSGKPLAITGAKARDYTHTERRRSDAILTSANTIINDDPQLNVRLADETIAKPLYVLDRQLKTPKNARAFQTTRTVTFIHSDSMAVKAKRRHYDNTKANFLSVRQLSAHELDMNDAIAAMSDAVHTLWVEAGGRLNASLIQQRLVNETLFYIGPKWVENGLPAFQSAVDFHKAKRIQWQQLGEDALCTIQWEN